MIKVFCNECREHIFNMEVEPQIGDLIKAEMFTPARDNIEQPKSGDLMECPYCHREWIRWRNGEVVLVTNRGIVPRI